MGSSAATPPRSINAAIAVLDRTPARSLMVRSPPAQNGLTMTMMTIAIMASVGTSFTRR